MVYDILSLIRYMDDLIIYYISRTLNPEHILGEKGHRMFKRMKLD